MAMKRILGSTIVQLLIAVIIGTAVGYIPHKASIKHIAKFSLFDISLNIR